jgi:7,8-dihydropterin-6-yl-methyl-4-(beta-D-ribofuranosyl)aminobenzene 5'-phosphate synthase
MSDARMAEDLKITILSTGVADGKGIAEWGFSALVESGGKAILFDTGMRPDTVSINCKDLGVDLSPVEDVVLSHSHDDHFGGLLALRREYSERNPKALGRAWVAEGFFLPWEYTVPGEEETNAAPRLRKDFEALGGAFTEVPKPAELLPGVWITGPIPRPFDEINWPKGFAPIALPSGGTVEWVIQDDQALVASTPAGLVVLTGCGHSGVANTLAYAANLFPGKPVEALIGGMHLLDADDETIEWTAAQVARYKPSWIMATHCTGLEAVYRWRGLLGLDRGHLSPGAVGARYSAAAGLAAGPGGIER